MPLTYSEEAKLRVLCHSHNIPTHVQARSRQIAEMVEDNVSLYAESAGFC